MCSFQGLYLCFVLGNFSSFQALCLCFVHSILLLFVVVPLYDFLCLVFYIQNIFDIVPFQCQNCSRVSLSYILSISFSRMRSEGSRFTWGSGDEAVFAKFCVCVRNRSQPFATVRNRRRPVATVCVSAVKLSTVASASGVVPKACQVE